MARVEKPSALKVTPEEKAQVKVLVERVVQLVRDGVTGMDLLEVFLRRRIQSLQAHDHPMWMYSGIDDTTRIHPEEVDDATLERWLKSITGNKDNPRGLGGFLHSTTHTRLTRYTWSSVFLIYQVAVYCHPTVSCLGCCLLGPD